MIEETFRNTGAKKLYRSNDLVRGANDLMRFSSVVNESDEFGLIYHKAREIAYSQSELRKNLSDRSMLEDKISDIMTGIEEKKREIAKNNAHIAQLIG